MRNHSQWLTQQCLTELLPGAIGAPPAIWRGASCRSTTVAAFVVLAPSMLAVW